MSNHPPDDDIDALAARIRRAEAKPEPGSKNAPANRAGFDFAGAVVGSVLVGWLIDRQFDTSPWGIVGMVIVGFVLGIYMSWKASQEPEIKK